MNQGNSLSKKTNEMFITESRQWTWTVYTTPRLFNDWEKFGLIDNAICKSMTRNFSNEKNKKGIMTKIHK